MTQKVAEQKNKNRGDCVCLRWGMCRVVFLNKTHFSLLILFFLKVWYISFFLLKSVLYIVLMSTLVFKPLEIRY